MLLMQLCDLPVRVGDGGPLGRRTRLSSLSSLSTTNLRPSVSVAAFNPKIESELPSAPRRAPAHALDRFVPAKIPRKRRFQTLAVAAWSTSILWCPFLFLFLLCVLRDTSVPGG